MHDRATLTNTTVEDTDRARLIYEGSWTSNDDVRFSGNTSTYTNEQLSVSLKFNGSVVYVYGDTVNVRPRSFVRYSVRARP